MLLPTVYGQVKVDVLEVRQIEIDQPSDDPGDRLHAFAHAWASDTATEITIEVAPIRDLQDIARIILDEQARPAALAQLAACDTSAAADIGLHVDLWMVDRRRQSLRWIHDAGGTDLTPDDLALVAELLLAACRRSSG